MVKKKEKEKPAKKSTKKKYYYGLGRRRTASAQVRIFKGKGETIVNDKPIGEYFPGKVAEFFYNRPFRVCDCLGKFYMTVRVEGSGKNAQLEAVVHGLARALDKVDPEFHSFLKKHKLLTRDSRQRERRKAGQAGRARRKKQSPKR